MDTTQTAEREELASQLVVEVNRGRASFYRMLAQLYFKGAYRRAGEAFGGHGFLGHVGR